MGRKLLRVKRVQDKLVKKPNIQQNQVSVQVKNQVIFDKTFFKQPEDAGAALGLSFKLIRNIFNIKQLFFRLNRGTDSQAIINVNE